MNKLKHQFFMGVMKYYMFLALAIIMWSWHRYMGLNIDSTWFSLQLDDRSWWEYLQWRYETWSSRLFIEGALVLFTRHIGLWRVFDTVIIVMIPYMITKLIRFEHNKELAILSCALFLCYPFKNMNSAGWIATTMNYLWPLAAILCGLLVVKKLYCGKKVRRSTKIFTALILLYGCNQEQSAAVFTGILCCLAGYNIWKKQRTDPWMMVYLLEGIFSMIFILTCPGNAVRKTTEIEAYFPDFSSLSIFTKLDIGATSVFYYSVAIENVLFLILTMVLFLVIRKICENRWIRWISAIPFLAALACTLVTNYTGEQWELLTGIGALLSTSLTSTGTYVASSKFSVLLLIMYLGVFLCMCVSIGVIWKQKMQNGLLALLILGVGFASRFMMCMSASIWMSGNRTYLFWEFAMMVLIMFLVEQYCDKRYLIWVTRGVCVTAILVSYGNYLYLATWCG